MSSKTVSRLPAIGIVLALVFLALSASRFPGGYDWTRHYISMLFSPITPDGAPNPSRPLAVVGMLLFCTSMALHFQLLSNRVNSVFHKKTIQIAGIGSMVYALLTVTVMHDLMVTISLVFTLVALCAMLHLLYIQRAIPLLSLGAVSLVILLSSAIMYYGHLFLLLLPVFQKLSFAACVGWLFAVQFADSRINSGQRSHA